MAETPDAAPDRELRPTTRHEWESVLLRARLGSVVGGTGRVGKNGRVTRGGVSGTTFKAVLLVIATHADPDGTRVWPGDATVAVLAETSVQVVQAVRRALVRLGLLEKVRARSRRQRRGDEYRLTLPSDLLDAVEVLSPAAVKVAAMDLYEKRRGKRGGSGGTPTDATDLDGVGDPADPPHEDDTVSMGDPVDTPQAEPDETCGGSGGTTTDVYGGSGGTHVGDPVARDTYPETPPRTTTQPNGEDVRTAVTVSRASEADEEPISAEEGESESPTLASRWCPAHGKPSLAGNRDDGLPCCAFCRAGTARVIPLRPRQEAS